MSSLNSLPSRREEGRRAYGGDFKAPRQASGLALTTVLLVSHSLRCHASNTSPLILPDP